MVDFCFFKLSLFILLHSVFFWYFRRFCYFYHPFFMFFFRMPFSSSFLCVCLLVWQWLFGLSFNNVQHLSIIFLLNSFFLSLYLSLPIVRFFPCSFLSGFFCCQFPKSDAVLFLELSFILYLLPVCSFLLSLLFLSPVSVLSFV